jgi:hypothetical protein
MKRNAFDLKIYEIKEVLADKKIKETIISMLFPVLIYLGISKKNSNNAARKKSSSSSNNNFNLV